MDKTKVRRTADNAFRAANYLLRAYEANPENMDASTRKILRETLKTLEKTIPRRT